MKFYPSADNFTQALLVMLVTNIMSVSKSHLENGQRIAIYCQQFVELAMSDLRQTFNNKGGFFLSLVGMV